MIKVRTVLQYEGWPAEEPRKAMRETLRPAFQAIAAAWHAGTLPAHFREDAVYRYGYQPRTMNYQAKKRKKMGHNRPLDWSGKLRMIALANPKISASPQGATVNLQHLPAVGLSGRVMRRRTRDGGVRSYRYPDLRRELTALTRREMDEMAKDLAARVAAGLEKIRARRAIEQMYGV